MYFGVFNVETIVTTLCHDFAIKICEIKDRSKFPCVYKLFQLKTFRLRQVHSRFYV